MSNFILVHPLPTDLDVGRQTGRAHIKTIRMTDSSLHLPWLSQCHCLRDVFGMQPAQHKENGFVAVSC